MEVAELIAKLGQCEQDIFTDFNKYRALKWRISDPGTLHDNEDLQKMTNLHSPCLLCQSITNKQKKIKAARKASAATAASTSSSNVVITSISSTAAAQIHLHPLELLQTKLEQASTIRLRHLVSPLLCVLCPMTLPELVLVSILCRTSHLFLHHIL